MVQAGNKEKHLLLVNHTTIDHHLHHHRHGQDFFKLLSFLKNDAVTFLLLSLFVFAMIKTSLL